MDRDHGAQLIDAVRSVSANLAIIARELEKARLGPVERDGHEMIQTDAEPSHFERYGP